MHKCRNCRAWTNGRCVPNVKLTDPLGLITAGKPHPHFGLLSTGIGFVGVVCEEWITIAHGNKVMINCAAILEV